MICRESIADRTRHPDTIPLQPSSHVRSNFAWPLQPFDQCALEQFPAQRIGRVGAGSHTIRHPLLAPPREMNS